MRVVYVHETPLHGDFVQPILCLELNHSIEGVSPSLSCKNCDLALVIIVPTKIT